MSQTPNRLPTGWEVDRDGPATEVHEWAYLGPNGERVTVEYNEEDDQYALSDGETTQTLNAPEDGRIEVYYAAYRLARWTARQNDIEADDDSAPTAEA